MILEDVLRVENSMSRNDVAFGMNAKSFNIPRRLTIALRVYNVSGAR